RLPFLSLCREAAARAAASAILTLAMAVAIADPLHAQDTPESTRAKQDVLWARMEDSVRRIAAAADAVVGVSIVDLTDHRAFHLNADAVYPTASSIKVAILAELFRQDADAGTGGAARLSDTYTLDPADLVGGSGLLGGFSPGVSFLTNRDLATLMIGVSDNSATNILTSRVGMDNVNALLARLGLRATRLRRRMMDAAAARAGRENTATPREFTALLDSLHTGRVLGGATEAYFRMLGTQKSSYLPALLPASVRTANKPGELDGVRNDVGVVFVPNRPFAIAVMTTYGGDPAAAERAISLIARAAWTYFDRIGRSNPLGRPGG
ncbi:MAG: serine hydrolase, partial [Gemmatimonadota bacterium]|nr:serine hydrolase [Gemmatimonadota bacterium]